MIHTSKHVDAYISFVSEKKLGEKNITLTNVLQCILQETLRARG